MPAAASTTPFSPASHVSKRERLARVVGGPFTSRALRQLFRTPGIVCITHHRVADGVQHDPDVISATPRQLERQAEWVKSAFLTLSGDEVSSVIAGRKPLREPAVAFTFDDAYEDNYRAGQILMQQFGIAATFFVPTGFIETGVIPAWDRLGYAFRNTHKEQLHIPALEGHGGWQVDLRDYSAAITAMMAAYSSLPAALQPAFLRACEEAAATSAEAEGVRSPFMTWEQIRALRAMGHTIGAHTHTHPVLAALAPGEQAEEIRSSRQILEERLGAPVEVFAYPYGKPDRSFSAVTKQLVADSGFKAAFSFYGGWNCPAATDPYDVKRIKVDPATSMPMFRTRVTARGVIPV